MKLLTTSLLCILGVGAAMAATPTITIDASKPVAKVSPILYGLMTEEINHSYDGGLYAELVQNRAFLDNKTEPVHWSVVQKNGAAATMALDRENPLNQVLTTSLRFHVTSASANALAGLANDGYWGIPVRPQTSYHASFYAKAAPDFSGPVTVAIVSTDGKTVYARSQVAGLSKDWQRYKLTLQTGDLVPTTDARLVLSVTHPGTIWFDLVSLFPPTWDNQPNGFRKDIMQMLVDLHPKFLRFPGGNYLEGNTINTRFEWKKTIGPISQRPGHQGPWGYRSTDGMGLLEFLQWCQDMKAEPVLAVYAGYSLSHVHVQLGPGLEPYVQDALDEIEYVMGPTTSKWGAERAKDGHPEPFPLHYVEIGNEDWFDSSGSYDQRFTQFYHAIKAKYPQLECISTVGTEHPASQRVKSVEPDVLDEHYYRSADWFIEHSPTHFNDYSRNGPKIFVGEWASHETSFPPWDRRSRNLPPTPNMKAALGDAAWMAAMEHNSDLVSMQCYAPLLVNVNPGARQWRPDLIGYNGLSVYGSPSYYAFRMFSRHVGDEILKSTRSDTPVQDSVTRDSQTGTIIIKLVNPESTPQPVSVNLKGVDSVSATGTAITMAAAPNETNSINDPDKVVPVTSKVTGIKPEFVQTLPASSITVLELEAH